MEEADDLVTNPFTALFQNFENAKKFAEGTKLALSSLPLGKIENDESIAEDVCSAKPVPNFNKDVIFSQFIERVFKFTIDFDEESRSIIQFGGLPHVSVKLVETRKECKDKPHPFLLSMGNLNQALYERLQISKPSNSLMTRSGYANDSSNEQNKMQFFENVLISYLSDCYCSINREEALLKYKLSTASTMLAGKGEDYQKELSVLADECRKLVISYSGSILLQPEIFPVYRPYTQLSILLQSAYSEPHLNDYVEKLIMMHDSQDDLEIIFSPILDDIWSALDMKLLDPTMFKILHALTFYSKHSSLASCLLKSKYWLPTPVMSNGNFSYQIGASFEHQTFLGKILHLSSLPDAGKQSEHFLTPSLQRESEMVAITTNIRKYIDTLVTLVHKFLHNLCLLPGFKHEVLVWIGLCLNANAKNLQMFADKTFVAGPGFFLNLTHVLLKFCEPFSMPTSNLLSKVDCRYAAVSGTAESIMKSDTPIHAVALEKYTTMVPKPDEMPPIDASGVKFNFTSEMFFLTHICYKLGFIKVYENYEDLMKRLSKLSNVYQDAVRQGGVPSAIEGLKNDFEQGMRLQLSIKAHLLNPSLADISLKFSVASGYWLVQQTLAREEFPITKFMEFQADGLNSEIPPALTVIPELIPENVGETLRFMGHFDGDSLERCEHLLYVMNFFAVFLGAKNRIKNPHLRAKLAECLAVFLPKDKVGLSGMNNFSLNHRKQALELSPVIVEVLPQSLLQLFVDIEFTGHTMEFDQKFMYRRYMYVILEYVWKIPSYLTSFKNLHKKGKQMYDREKQLGTFPRFINLLINDSTFLLDEALQNLVAIKELEKEKSSGRWDNLPPQEKQEKEKHLSQCGHFAEGYNTMAKETVNVLCYITKDINRPFVSHIMADSMASFLNYFFVHLVGPKRKQLKVSDFKKYNFEPDQLVKNITKIYLQLGKHDDFCQSIAKDKRSYSLQLFESAVSVLQRLEGAYDMAHELQALSLKLEDYSLKLVEAEKEMPEPPEEFIDPISCELMQQPVRLPSSGKIICRSTIAKHLLSDEKDPFNRSPLRLDQVIPCVELEQRIKDWMKENLVESQGNMAD